MKRLVQYALNQPLFILLGTLLFAMAGVFAFKNLSVEAFPDVTDTQVTVIALYPGRAAEEVEKHPAAHGRAARGPHPRRPPAEPGRAGTAGAAARRGAGGGAMTTTEN